MHLKHVRIVSAIMNDQHTKLRRLSTSVYLASWRGGGFFIIVLILSVIQLWPGHHSLAAIVGAFSFALGVLTWIYVDEYLRPEPVTTKSMAFAERFAKFLPAYLVLFSVGPWLYVHRHDIPSALPGLGVLWLACIAILLMRPRNLPK